ncbi:MAG TPA: isoprenyl transferase [Epulopiscium sp.]|nr:isoprenyl transferase [Candidatus Epulonipiscium sp.]
MNLENLPEHVAIIMDGNGRWAKSHNRARDFGHQRGAKVLEKISLYANKIGITYMTVYAFSTENWNRPKDEVNGLMDLLRRYLKGHIKDSSKNNLKMYIIGDTKELPEDIQVLITKLENITKDKDGMILNIALNYGGRDEIMRGIRKLLVDVKSERINGSQINEEVFAKYLDTAHIPDPDLLIRTSGEQRLSNFLTWQSAYSEFYFADCLWPDFSEKEFEKALEVYKSRERRFGTI